MRRSRAAGGTQRKTRAPFWLSWLLALGIASVGFAQVRTEYEVDLGDGYDAAMIAKPTNAPFEALAHLLFLRHNGEELCELGSYDLSPDKRFIAYQESRTGKIFLLEKKRGTTFELINNFSGLARHFDWRTKPDFLRVEIEGKGTMEFSLPEKTQAEKLQMLDLPMALLMTVNGAAFVLLRKQQARAREARVQKGEMTAEEAKKKDRIFGWGGWFVLTAGLVLVGVWAAGY